MWTLNDNGHGDQSLKKIVEKFFRFKEEVNDNDQKLMRPKTYLFCCYQVSYSFKKGNDEIVDDYANIFHKISTKGIESTEQFDVLQKIFVQLCPNEEFLKDTSEYGN